MSKTSAVSVITAHLVPEDLRPHFLPRHLGSLMLQGEFLVYGWLEQLSKDYGGGLWKFYDLSNGGFYMAPCDDKRFKIDVSGNYFSGEMSADAAGIVASLFAQCDLANRYGVDKLIDQYQWLRNFAIEHAESDSIMSAID